jgi:hypothetical protein
VKSKTQRLIRAFFINGVLFVGFALLAFLTALTASSVGHVPHNGVEGDWSGLGPIMVLIITSPFVLVWSGITVFLFRRKSTSRLKWIIASLWLVIPLSFYGLSFYGL